MKGTDISILCVEDEPITREFLSKLISMKFPEQKIHTAENGKAGLELFREIDPEVVLTDISMPVMDGIQMAQEMRMLKPDAFIIALSAHSSLEGLADDPGTLFTRYILKPFIGKQLFDAIDECLARITRKTGKEEEAERGRLAAPFDFSLPLNK